MKLLVITLLLLPIGSLAAQPEFSLSIKDHRFVPAELRVPAGQKIRLRVVNQDGTPEEFESPALAREKLIAGHATARLYLGPLDPGVYTFIGDFHAKSARGAIVVE